MSVKNGQFVYDVPIIPTNLRHEETIHQICDALQYLKTISKDVFDRLNKRISENREKLGEINSRIDSARTKIDALKGVNKATKVFSSAKYPASNDDALYSRIYPCGTCVQFNRAQYKVESRHTPFHDEILRDKLSSFDTPMHLDVTAKQNMDHGEGLGRLPQNISSISSLLLFNTSENPYKKYVILDPLGVVTKTRKEEVDEALPDAPQTILQREEMHRQTVDNYSYMPGMGDVPEIAVPDFLPDLVGVADDLSYSAELGPSIAPSVPTGAIPELPDFNQEETLPSGPVSTQSNNIPPPVAPPPAPSPPATPVIPPPPPPPPPPLPPSSGEAPSLPTTGNVIEDSKPAAAAVPTPDASRASLLESIRQAGGIGKAKLKSAKERKIAVKKQKQEEKDHSAVTANQASSGGNLMSDLTAKLLLRRKGISGTVKTGDKTTDSGPPPTDRLSKDSAMERISAMIPPPSSDMARPDEDDWN